MYSKMRRVVGSGGCVGGGGKDNGHRRDKKIYSKVAATFECQNPECRNCWRSLHGWSGRDESARCQACGSEAHLYHLSDQMTWFDHFNCCSDTWQKIHLGDPAVDARCGIVREVPEDQCKTCGGLVIASGPQQRHARVYFFRCLNENCPQKKPHYWNDFSFEEKASQQCEECFNSGKIVEVACISGRPAQERKRDPKKKKREHYHHLSDCCDMCQKLLKEGKFMTCIRWKQVQCQLKKNEGGTITEKVIKLVPITQGCELIDSDDDCN